MGLRFHAEEYQRQHHSMVVTVTYNITRYFIHPHYGTQLHITFLHWTILVFFRIGEKWLSVRCTSVTIIQKKILLIENDMEQDYSSW